mmetsp:Transcript_37557/g.108206  ORF Transcript_37557/g.108206 Transcript_37557/m.108206 type:complete len:315 (+) Transcript_37557:130-1074(+)
MDLNAWLTWALGASHALRLGSVQAVEEGVQMLVVVTRRIVPQQVLRIGAALKFAGPRLADPRSQVWHADDVQTSGVLEGARICLVALGREVGLDDALGEQRQALGIVRQDVLEHLRRGFVREDGVHARDHAAGAPAKVHGLALLELLREQAGYAREGPVDKGDQVGIAAGRGDDVGLLDERLERLRDWLLLELLHECLGLLGAGDAEVRVHERLELLRFHHVVHDANSRVAGEPHVFEATSGRGVGPLVVAPAHVQHLAVRPLVVERLHQVGREVLDAGLHVVHASRCVEVFVVLVPERIFQHARVVYLEELEL